MEGPYCANNSVNDEHSEVELERRPSEVAQFVGSQSGTHVDFGIFCCGELALECILE